VIQAAASLALIALVLDLYRRSRTTAMVFVWLLWLLIPLIRRLFDAVADVPLQGDPLVLVPFAGTLLIGLLELRRSGLSPPCRRIAMVFCAGLLIGVPAGILADFKWFAYSSFAYTSCLAAVAIGYSERKDGARTPLLARVLLLAMPFVAVYGIYQYFAGLPSWDLDFLRSVTVFDGGLDAPGDPGHWRVFSTLKHPDTLAALLAVAIILVLAARRFTAVHWLALPLLVVALALTYVRGVWVALLVALLIYALLVRGAAVLRLAAVIAACVAVGALGSGADPTVAAVTERATTIADAALGRVGFDIEPADSESTDSKAASKEELERSARILARISTLDRLNSVNEVLSSAPKHPIGHGIGQPGNGYDLDNGYLLLIYQLGPLGALLVIAAVGYVLILAVRVVQARSRQELPAALLAIVLLLAGLELTQDAFYGVIGAVFWYSAGWILRLVEECRPEALPHSPRDVDRHEKSLPTPPAIPSGSAHDRVPVAPAGRRG
jgi:O-Antigen ligase